MMKRAVIFPLLYAAALGTGQAAEPVTGTATGKSQMGVGFTPPEKPASGPVLWTQEDLLRVHHFHEHARNPESTNPPRCEQDRLLTDTRPCNPKMRSTR
jgi:hypothetical protein